MTQEEFSRDQVREYVRTHPDKNAVEVLGSLGLDPSCLDEVSTDVEGRKEDTASRVTAANHSGKDGNPSSYTAASSST